jgi:hypothetical protein
MSKGSISKKENPTPEKGIRKERKKKNNLSLLGLLLAALDGGEWSASRPGRFTSQGKSCGILTPEECSPIHIRMLGVGHSGEGKNSQPLPEIEPCRPSRNLVTILTELPRLGISK